RGHVDALDQPAVAGPPAILDGAVAAPLLEVLGERLERTPFAEPGAERLREVGHLLEVGDAPLVDPPVELPRVERTLPELFLQEPCQAVERKTQEVERHVRAGG